MDPDIGVHDDRCAVTSEGLGEISTCRRDDQDGLPHDLFDAADDLPWRRHRVVDGPEHAGGFSELLGPRNGAPSPSNLDLSQRWRLAAGVQKWRIGRTFDRVTVSLGRHLGQIQNA